MLRGVLHVSSQEEAPPHVIHAIAPIHGGSAAPRANWAPHQSPKSTRLGTSHGTGCVRDSGVASRRLAKRLLVLGASTDKCGRRTERERERSNLLQYDDAGS